ncbi:MAG: glycosyltransferase family 4 protein [Betaproteobacteria bacterium]|nr:glycosyltransferase family 4 protein [Betaproteobacteria bacterium]
MRILFHDAVSALAYDAEFMDRHGVGGTEGTVVRVAEGLSAAHEVCVAQRGRELSVSPHQRLRYVPLDEPRPFGGAPPDWIVVLRKHRLVPGLRARYPSAALVSWIHNWQHGKIVILRRALARSGCVVVAVSEAHRADTDRRLNGRLARAIIGGGRIPVRRIYNPVDDALAPDDTPVDIDKMVCFSRKGLHRVLAAFAAVRGALPTLRLYIAGDDAVPAQAPGVHLLGRLPQHKVFRHVREALCVFYPQDEHPETFGLVFAEANALGVPVLAHDFGSAREVLGSEEQVVDARNIPAIVDRLRAWRAGGRPRVSLRPELRSASVVGEWRRLLESAYSHSMVAGGLEEMS